MSSEQSKAERVTEIIELLRPERSRKLPESLTAAAMDGDLERMQLFLDGGANIEARSVGFASPLGAACSLGQVESARWLIAHGAVLDPPGAQISPIQSALGKMNCAAAALLLDAGLPIEHAAWGVIASAMLGRLDVIQWLLSRGVELDRSYPRLGVLREKALASAKKEGKEEIVRFLRGELDAGPPPALPPSPVLRRERPRAAPGDRARLLEEALELVRAGGKAAGRWKATGLAASKRGLLISHAAGHGVGEIVIALRDAGAPLDFPNDGTEPPLYRAAGEAHLDVVRILLDRGAPPNGHDGKIWLPLEAAVMSGEPEVVGILLEAGANVKAKPAGGGAIADRVRGPYAAEIRALLEQTSRPKTRAKTKPKK